PFPLPPAPLPLGLDFGEGYYEEAQPYEEAINDDGDALSSSYESYDEEEVVVRGNATCPLAQHRWPSTEASIELVKDARICAFLWRKKWLGQWAKQLCVIKDCRLQCYKSSKEQTPLLDVNLLGCSVVYKEKLMKRKEHKMKIVPVGGEAIVLGLQSKEQTEQWLKVIQDISPQKPTENCESQHTSGEMSERHSVASESGSSTDSHAETHDPKDVKKKYGASRFSNLMNIGKKKTSPLDSLEKCIDTSGYLNVLVNSQWRSRWCLIRDGQLWFYSDKGRGKESRPALALGGCSIVPHPSPEHLYTFRIHLDGTQLATLEAKTSADMGQWLGFLLSQTGTRTEPEDLTYDYVSTDRISTIINAANDSMCLMQRRYSEPNSYIENAPPGPQLSDDLYDDVASIGADLEDAEGEHPLSEENSFQEDTSPVANDSCSPEEESVYLDLTPVRSFLHTNSVRTPGQRETHAALSTPASPASPRAEPPLEDTPAAQTVELDPSNRRESELQHTAESRGPATPERSTVTPGASVAHKAPHLGLAGGPGSSSLPPLSPHPRRGRSMGGGDRPKTMSTGSPGAVEVKLGKNRTEADVRLYSEERDRLEKEREEVRSALASFKKERRETREELHAWQGDPRQKASLEAALKQKEEACREAEHRRVEVELQLMEVRESLRKVEAGPFTLGTTLDSSHQDHLHTSKTPSVAPTVAPTVATPPPPPSTNGSCGDPATPVNCATALKTRPAPMMAPSKVNVLRKAKEWEKKSSS
ncbi:hypothetical protein NHX12_025556, partial [Muraenolepis orangiensis]